MIIKRRIPLCTFFLVMHSLVMQNGHRNAQLFSKLINSVSSSYKKDGNKIEGYSPYIYWRNIVSKQNVFRFVFYFRLWVGEY